MEETVTKFIKEFNKFDNLIEITFVPNRIQSFFGVKTKTITYIGNGTVWHESDPVNDVYTRTDIHMESKISDINKFYFLINK